MTVPSNDAKTLDAQTLRAEVQVWIKENWDPTLRVREWWERLAAVGYAHPTWPIGLGGLAVPSSLARVIGEALGAAGTIAPPTGHLAAPLAVPTILAHGQPDQIERMVRPIARGEVSWCQLFSEPGAGSDLASLATRAVRDGDEWIVSGQKVWNSSADQAQFGMLLARTDVDVPKHKGITYFVIDMNQPGVEARPLKQMNGQSNFCEVFFTEARVRHVDMLGPLNDGWRIAQTTLAAERASLSSRPAPGLTPARSGPNGDLDRECGEVIAAARRTQRSRVTGGAVPARIMIELAQEHGVHHESVIRQRLARYYAQTRVDAWTLRRSAAAKGRMTGADGGLAKLATARICQESRDLSFAILGASSLLNGDDAVWRGELHRIGLGSPGNRFGGGTDEIQLNVIGERGLGLPREPGSDHEVPYRELRVGTQRNPS